LCRATLVLIFINELIDIIESCGVTIKIVANDAKIYAQIIYIRDVEYLQRALDLLVGSAELWELNISINKCFTLNIGQIPSYVLVSGSLLNIVWMTAITICSILS